MMGCNYSNQSKQDDLHFQLTQSSKLSITEILLLAKIANKYKHISYEQDRYYDVLTSIIALYNDLDKNKMVASVTFSEDKMNLKLQMIKKQLEIIYVKQYSCF